MHIPHLANHRGALYTAAVSRCHCPHSTLTQEFPQHLQHKQPYKACRLGKVDFLQTFLPTQTKRLSSCRRSRSQAKPDEHKLCTNPPNLTISWKPQHAPANTRKEFLAPPKLPTETFQKATPQATQGRPPHTPNTLLYTSRHQGLTPKLAHHSLLICVLGAIVVGWLFHVCVMCELMTISEGGFRAPRHHPSSGIWLGGAAAVGRFCFHQQ